LRLAWDAHIVMAGRAPQAIGLVFSTVLVLLVWTFLRSGSNPSDGGGGGSGKQPSGGLYDDAAPAGLPSNWTAVRLPVAVQPISYAIGIAVDLQPVAAFSGSVEIALNVTAATRVLAVHAAGGLAVNGAALRLPVPTRSGALEWATASPAVMRHDADNEYVVLSFDRALRASSQWVLSLNFTGALTDSMRGFYLSSYDSAGATHFVATTQFQPTDARRAFPCFDEPNMKAAFQINLTVPQGYSALSNMPVVAVEDSGSGSHKKYHFAETTRMSTYLVAFVVSNFERLTATTHSGVKLSVYAQPGRQSLCQLALDSAARILEYFESAFGIAYPLPKLDLVAIPDFAAGAMENWGLVTFRESALLFDENSSSPSDKELVVASVAHEWWGDLWINEGFATFMEFKGTDVIEPSWRMQDQFLFQATLEAMDADSSVLSHPVSLNVTTNEEIEDIFDEISYAKGASLLRMTQAWLDAVRENGHFFSRLSDYLKAFAYSNARTEDLWEYLGSHGLNVGDVMQSWATQPGYPVLVVEGGPETATYYVKQRRFLRNASFNSTLADTGNDTTDLTWRFPVFIRGYSRAGVRIGGLWVEEMKPSGDEPLVLRDGSAQYLLLNAGRHGFYRVMYPLEVWNVIVDWVRKDVLGPADKLGVISDAFELNLAGVLDDVTVPLRLAKSLADEVDFAVWTTALRELKFVEDTLVLDSNAPLFDKFQRRILQNLVGTLSWNASTEDHGSALLRGGVLTKAIELDMPSVTGPAYEYFSRLRDDVLGESQPATAASNTEPLPPRRFSERDVVRAQARLGVAADALAAVWAAGVAHGTDDDFAFAVEACGALAALAPERDRVLRALASARRTYQVRSVLDMSLAGKPFRKQDVPSLYREVARRHAPSHVHLWSFLKDRWPDVVALWNGSDWTPLNSVLRDVVALFTEPSAIEEARRLFVEGTNSPKRGWFVPPLADKAVLQGIEVQF
ncbi:hypothetical protein HK405_008920, partial [Cladochytrium tenue]